VQLTIIVITKFDCFFSFFRDLLFPPFFEKNHFRPLHFSPVKNVCRSFVVDKCLFVQMMLFRNSDYQSLQKILSFILFAKKCLKSTFSSNLSLCAWVCMCVCVWACVCESIRVCVWEHSWVCERECVHMFELVYLYMCVRVFVSWVCVMSIMERKAIESSLV